MNFTKRFLLISVILVSTVGCDQATKSIVVSHLAGMTTVSYLGGTVRLQLTYNSGAFLSLGNSLPEVWRHSIFTVGMGVVLLAALMFALFSAPGRFSVVSAVSFLVAGGAGNLIDRIRHHGLVTDFLNIGIGPVRTGIFNIADAAIVAGAVILFWQHFASHRASPDA